MKGPIYGFIISNEKMLMDISDPVPKIPLLPIPNPILQNGWIFGISQENACMIFEINPDETFNSHFRTIKYSFMDLRKIGMMTEKSTWYTCACAVELVDWHKKTQFCGRCGTRYDFSPVEEAKQCPNCKLIENPRLSPAMIVAIRKDKQILLAHNKRFPGPMHSILAGFVIPGESVEDTIKREVKEEAGIEIKNIKYFGSQPWPFPNSLMLGFTAEYAGGNLFADGEEIDHIDWYSIDQLPPIPPPLSISRQLIDWTLNQIISEKK